MTCLKISTGLNGNSGSIDLPDKGFSLAWWANSADVAHAEVGRISCTVATRQGELHVWGTSEAVIASS